MSSRAALVMAVPKGRTLGPVSKLLTKVGVTAAPDASGAVGPLATVLSEDSRALIRRASFLGQPLDMLLLKPDDVPTYVEYGAADLGIAGRDVLVEREVDVYQPVDLGLGKCRMVVAGKAGDHSVPAGRMPRVATKFPRTAAAHFARKGIQVEVVNVQGSVELAPLVGLADYIVDLVETGTTLAENGLEVKEDISKVSSMLISNRASYKLRGDVIGAFVTGLRDALTKP